MSLLDEGYFEKERGTADIRQTLVAKGYNKKANAISNALLALTQKGKLSRREIERGQFLYRTPR